VAGVELATDDWMIGLALARSARRTGEAPSRGGCSSLGRRGEEDTGRGV
jgi:hypothetical protein